MSQRHLVVKGHHVTLAHHVRGIVVWFDGRELGTYLSGIAAMQAVTNAVRHAGSLAHASA